MPFRNKRLCIFGDSHFACTKLAYDRGIVQASDIDVEFWGNIGRQFRHLTWRNDQVEPLDEFTASRFAKTNRNERKVLAADDFDMIFFMGCRIDLYRLFPEALHRRRNSTQSLSSAAEARWIGDFLRRLPPYHFARNFATQDKSRIVVAPVPFDTGGFDETIPERFAGAREANAQDREELWKVVEAIMAEDGIELLRQPEETVVDGCCTDPSFAVRNHLERNDRTHKNPDYGAIVLGHVFEKLRQS